MNINIRLDKILIVRRHVSRTSTGSCRRCHCRRYIRLHRSCSRLQRFSWRLFLRYCHARELWMLRFSFKHTYIYQNISCQILQLVILLLCIIRAFLQKKAHFLIQSILILDRYHILELIEL